MKLASFTLVAAGLHALALASIDVSKPRWVTNSQEVIAVELLEPPSPQGVIAPPPPKVPAPRVPAPKVPAPKVPAPKVPAPKVPAPKVPAPKVPAPKVPAAFALSMRRASSPDLSLPEPAPPLRKLLARPSTAPRLDDGSADAIKRRLDALLAADRARRNVDQGRVAPALYEIEREASKAFTPKWSLSEGNPRKLGSISRSLASTLRGFAKAYLQRLESYARLPAEQEEKRPEMLEGYQRLARAAEKEAGLLSCELCVTFRPGRTPAIRLERRSENLAFNRLAKRALQRALRLQGPKTPPKGEACYRFAAKFHRAPPLPVAGCTFDEVHLSAECFYPFKKMLRREVTLLSAK